MKILDKLAQKNRDIYGRAPVTIAFLGDSVTQGCFESYRTGEHTLETVFDPENAFSAKLRTILAAVYPRAQINIINAGISGDCAKNGLKRLDRDVLRFNPDLVVVAFALNDCGKGDDGIDEYTSALGQIFAKLTSRGIESIFLTPNVMTDETSPRFGYDEFFQTQSKRFLGPVQSGVLDRYVTAGRREAQRNSVPVCDVYAKWIALQESGANITELLANYLNHPVRKLHEMIAWSLFDTMLGL